MSKSAARATSNLSSNALGAIFMMLSMAGFVFNDTLMKLVAGDTALERHLERWSITGQGIEAFPTDPFVRSNWGAERLESATSLRHS